MNDYSINFTPEQYEGDPIATANVQGRYNQANFIANRQLLSLESIKQYLAAGVSIWDVPCTKDFYIEDNQEEEDADEEDEEEMKENSQLLEALSTFLTDRQANMGDLRKRIVFFLDREKKEIKKAKASLKARQMLGKDLGGQTPGSELSTLQ